jgi:hypothetical protein
MKTTGFCVGCLTLVLAAVSFCWLLPEQTASADRDQIPPRDLELLGPADKAELAEILRLKVELGDQVWPGLSRFVVLLIFYNERYEFLVGEANPPSPWEVVRSGSFQGQPYFRRAAEKSQSFAVAVGARWAGCLGTLEHMNSRIPFRLSREFHVVLALHEVFHAFQATLAPQRFAKAISVYKSEDKYPSHDPQFSSAWNREGEALSEALRATEEAAVSGLVKRFLDAREARRSQVMLDPELISYECELEWLEGLAKYAEVRFYELAASRASELAYASYRLGHPFWPADLARLRRNLGGQGEDLRFYLSGAAQAILLDRLSPGWKAEALEMKSNLEGFLRAAITPD